MLKGYLPLILIGVLMAAFYASTMSVLVFNLEPPLLPSSNVSNITPTVNILLYMGEMSNGKFGFGNTPINLTSPGPTLRLSTNDVVKITITNAGKLPHAFAITNIPSTGASVLFNAAIGSSTNPLQPGQQGSVIFRPNNAGFSYCYISPVSGDAEAGMYGTVTITTSSFSGS